MIVLSHHQPPSHLGSGMLTSSWYRNTHHSKSWNFRFYRWTASDTERFQLLLNCISHFILASCMKRLFQPNFPSEKDGPFRLRNLEFHLTWRICVTVLYLDSKTVRSPVHCTCWPAPYDRCKESFHQIVDLLFKPSSESRILVERSQIAPAIPVSYHKIRLLRSMKSLALSIALVAVVSWG